jgi:hypothetical protein
VKVTTLVWGSLPHCEWRIICQTDPRISLCQLLVSLQNSKCSTIRRLSGNEKNPSSFFGKHFWLRGRPKIFFLDKRSCWGVSNNLFSIKCRKNCWIIDTIERYEKLYSHFDTTKKRDKNFSSTSRLASKILFESLWNRNFTLTLWFFKHVITIFLKD